MLGVRGEPPTLSFPLSLPEGEGDKGGEGKIGGASRGFKNPLDKGR
jgi:hypothetical protein